MAILHVPYLECDRCQIGVMGVKDMTARGIRQSMQEDGWRMVSVDRKWVDLCPDCVRKQQQPEVTPDA